MQQRKSKLKLIATTATIIAISVYSKSVFAIAIIAAVIIVAIKVPSTIVKQAVRNLLFTVGFIARVIEPLRSGVTTIWQAAVVVVIASTAAAIVRTSAYSNVFSVQVALAALVFTLSRTGFFKLSINAKLELVGSMLLFVLFEQWLTVTELDHASIGAH